MRKSHLYIALAAVLGFAQAGIPVVVAQACAQAERPVAAVDAARPAGADSISRPGKPRPKGRALTARPRQQAARVAVIRRTSSTSWPRRPG